MNEGLHIRLFTFDFLCQRVFPDRIFLGVELFRIHKGNPPEFFGIQLLVNLHGRLHIFRLHNQGKLVPGQIAFDGVSPFFIPDIQKIRQDADGYVFAKLLVKALLDFSSGLLQLLGVGFPAQHDFHEVLLNQIRFLLQALTLGCRLLVLFLQVGPHLLQALFQTPQLLAGDGSLPEFINIPDCLVGNVLFLLPAADFFRKSGPPAFTSLKQRKVLLQALLLGFQLGIPAAYDLAVDLIVGGPIFLLQCKLCVQGFLLGQKILFPFLHPQPKLPNQLCQLENCQLIQTIAAAFGISFSLHKTVELIFDSCQLVDFLHGVLNFAAHTAVKDDALLHIFYMNVLLHADILFYEILQLDIHAEGNCALEQPGEFLHIQPAQVNIVQIPAEPFIIGGIEPFVPGKIVLQVTL